jgi:hypothetical protein
MERILPFSGARPHVASGHRAHPHMIAQRLWGHILNSSNLHTSGTAGPGAQLCVLRDFKM